MSRGAVVLDLPPLLHQHLAERGAVLAHQLLEHGVVVVHAGDAAALALDGWVGQVRWDVEETDRRTDGRAERQTRPGNRQTVSQSVSRLDVRHVLLQRGTHLRHG